MNEPVEKLPEQSVVSRALALRAKMASDDLYLKYIYGTIKNENYLSTQANDFKGDNWQDWEDK